MYYSSILNSALVSCAILAGVSACAYSNTGKLNFGKKPPLLETVTIDFSSAENNTQAILKALEKLPKDKPCKIILPKGKYNFRYGENLATTYTLFDLNGRKNITIDGNGSEFIVHGIISLFTAANAENITLQNFKVDWARAPFSVGDVVETGDKYFDVKVLPEYPVQGGEPVGAFMNFDRETRLPERQGLDVYNYVRSTELVSPQVLRLNLFGDLKIKKGALVALRHQVYHRNAFYFVRCKNLNLKNITVYTAPGMGLVADTCENINLDRFNVMLKPGTNHLVSTTADATHFKSCTGKISITNCTFEGMGDDAVNIGQLYLEVKEKVDDNTVLAAHFLGIGVTPDVGDRMEFCGKDDLLIYDTRIVKKVEELPEKGQRKVTFTESLPQNMQPGDVLGNSDKVATVHINKCKVKANRARGFLIQTRGAVIENCHFENVTSGGVWVNTEKVFFYEGVGARDTVIRNNTFINCNYGGPVGEGVVCVFAHLADFKLPPKPGVHQRITIENNNITAADNCGIFVCATDGITIRNNTIRKACDRPTNDYGKSALYIMSTANALIEGNIALKEEQGAGIREVLTFGPGCVMDTITIRNNKGF